MRPAFCISFDDNADKQGYVFNMDANLFFQNSRDHTFKKI